MSSEKLDFCQLYSITYNKLITAEQNDYITVTHYSNLVVLKCISLQMLFVVILNLLCRFLMADNERSPDILDKSPYTEKKCEREFRKLLETTNSTSPNKDPGCSSDKSNEFYYTEKKCEREFRKLLETTNSMTTDNETSIDKSSDTPYTEKKCEREFRKLLEGSDSKTANFYSGSPTDKSSEISYTERKCEQEFQNLFQNTDADTAADAYYNNENAIPEKKRKDDEFAEQNISDDSSCSSSIASFSHFQKCKALVCGESSGNLKAINHLVRTYINFFIKTFLFVHIMFLLFL